MTYIDPLTQIARGSQFVDNIFTRQANRVSGQRLRSRDYAGAADAQYANGNIDGGRILQQDGVDYAAAQRTAAEAQQAEQLDFTLQAIKALKGSQDPLAEFDRMAPVFRQFGTDEQQISGLRQQLEAGGQQFLNDAERVVGEQRRALTFQKAGDNLYVFEEGNPDPVNTFVPNPDDYTIGTTRFSGQTNEPVAQGYVAPEYIQQDPDKNLLEVSPGMAPVGRPGPAGSASPRGVRNNNPGNIEDGAFARSLPGYAGSDGRFAIFDSPEAGAQAAPRLLQSYIQRGFDTPAEIINRWAPPSDNNPTQAYAQYVAQRAGIGVNDTVTPDKIPLIAQAIREFENGERPSTGQNVSGGGPRVVAAAQQRDPAGSLLSEQEVIAAGLAPGTVAQRSATGQISILQGPQAQRNARPTEAQNKDSFNANRMARAGQIINQLESNNYDYGRAQLGAQGTENFRRYDAAAEEWTDSILRLTTGAAATRDEIASNRRAYFPVVGDSPAVREQKRRQREAVERDAIARGQGGASSGQATTSARSDNRPPPAAGFVRAPGLPFDISSGQAQTRQRLIQSGASPRADIGTARNPRYMNPRDPASTWANARVGDVLVRPDGRLVTKE